MTELLAHPAWMWVTMAAVVVGFIACVWFVIQLQTEAGWSWWDNPFGRFLMVRKILLALLFLLVMLNRVGPEWWDLWRIPLTAILMSAFALQTFVPYRLLVRANRQAHQGNREGEEAQS